MTARSDLNILLRRINHYIASIVLIDAANTVSNFFKNHNILC